MLEILCGGIVHTRNHARSCTISSVKTHCVSLKRLKSCSVTNKPYLSPNHPPFILQEAVGLIVVALSSFLHIDYFLYNAVWLAAGHGHFQTIVLRKYSLFMVSLAFSPLDNEGLVLIARVVSVISKSRSCFGLAVVLVLDILSDNLNRNLMIVYWLLLVAQDKRI